MISLHENVGRVGADLHLRRVHIFSGLQIKKFIRFKIVKADVCGFV